MLTRKQFLRSALDVAAATFGLTVLQACGTPPPGPTPAPLPDAADPVLGTDAAVGVPPGDGARDAGTDAGAMAGRCATNGTAVTIGENHGHVMVVSRADVAAAAAKTYHIQGTSDHDHTVALSGADFAQLQQDHAIMTTSSYDAGHSHPIMVACA